MSDAEGDDAGIEVSDGPSGRDVVVPMRLYKTVIVFSTLIAVVAVVLGFMFLDAATLRVSVLRSVLIALLGAVGLRIPEAVLSATLAVVGLLVIGFGALVYTFGTRFRARGMGKSQEDTDEGTNNG
jgi:predicted tellurium resistance membrane protein TerC